MKILLIFLLISFSNYTLSQSNKLETKLIDNIWIISNTDTSDYISSNIQGSDGYWEITIDSMIISEHCYMWETYHKVIFISNDSLILQEYNRVRNKHDDTIKIEPSEQYFHFASLDISEEKYTQLIWSIKKKTLHLIKPKEH